MFWFIFIVAIYLIIVVFVVDQQKAGPAERRIALVIGNAKYSIQPLNKPVKDAADMAEVLNRLGFKVLRRFDLGKSEMEKALKDFKDRSKDAAWSLIYFSGHGMELDGENWLIPIDAKFTKRAEVPDQAVLVERLLKRPTGAGGLRLVILDACRKNPFRIQVMTKEGLIRVTHGLGPMKPAYGEIMFFAARHGSAAYEGPDKERPSYFTEALLKYMEVEGLELGLFFRRVTNEVMKVTTNRQEPFVYGHIPDEDFYFKPPRRSR